jgi:rhodanese-related sulfurtransferase
VLPGIIGAIQANETLKLILGVEEGTLINRLLLFDAWKMRFRELKLRRDAECPICGPNATIHELIDYEEFCGLKSVATQDTAAVSDEGSTEITATELDQRLRSNEDIQIIDVREPHEFEIARIPGSKLIPLARVVERATEIDPTRLTVVHCKMGGRSAKAIQDLKSAGYAGRLLNLKGGITAWSNEVDNTVPKY